MVAELVEWNKSKRFGFLRVGHGRVFIHIRDFAEHHKRPEVGDKISFFLGEDVKGRVCAKRAVHINDGGRFTVTNLLSLIGLLGLPMVALWNWQADWRWATGLGAVINLITYRAYSADKQQARNQTWRTPEAALHLLALLVGWAGAFVAQKRLRHKCSKIGFQSLFWLIVLAHQLVALDSMQDWKLARTMWKQIGQVNSD